MGHPFLGHVDRVEFEARLRASFASPKVQAIVAGDPALECQNRAVEVSVQFALWMADELNSGTPPETLLSGGARLIGNMVENFAAGFATDRGEPDRADPGSNQMADDGRGFRRCRQDRPAADIRREGMMPVFRIHLTGGVKIDVTADTPDQARKEAQRRSPGQVITKIKIVKETA